MNTATHSDARYYTKRGRLTRYALACGYIERYTFNGTRYAHEVRLYMQHGVLFVRTERDELLYNGRDLTQARATYDCEVRAIKSVLRA